jgi:hypothetical protein
MPANAKLIAICRRDWAIGNSPECEMNRVEAGQDPARKEEKTEKAVRQDRLFATLASLGYSLSR